MYDPYYHLRVLTRGWLLENRQSQAQLSKLANLSEGFISEFLSGQCQGISATNYLKLQKIISKPLMNLNRGARLTNIQTTQKGQRFSQKVKGDVNLDGNMESARNKQIELQRTVETIAMKMEKIKRGEEVSLIDPRIEETLWHRKNARFS